MQIPSFSKSEHQWRLVRTITLAVATTLLFTTVGCDSGGSETFTASGVVVNSTDRGVDNAEISFSQDGSSVQTTTANDTGRYEIQGLNGGDYEVNINAPGYNETTFTASVNSNTTLPEQELLGPADVSGSVASATTGEALSQAEVAFTFGQDPDTSRSEADLITTTNSAGEYDIQSAPTGGYVCVIRAPGFLPAIVPDIEFEPGENDLGQTSTSESLEEGQVRIVLEWGENPSDLDSHLTGPAADGDRFHVYFANQEPADAGANLDVDDVTSFGPETITITNSRSGTYRYSVYNYSDQSDDGAVGIEESPASVKVFDSDGQQASYSPPPASPGDGNTWRVLEIDGGSLTLDDNSGDTFGYFSAESSSDVTIFSRPKNSKHTRSQESTLRRIFDRPLDSF